MKNVCHIKINKVGATVAKSNQEDVATRKAGKWNKTCMVMRISVSRQCKDIHVQEYGFEGVHERADELGCLFEMTKITFNSLV